MTNVLLSARSVGKRYRLSHSSAMSREGHLNLVDAHISHTDFWAVRDVSFELQAGEIVGLLGRNGAGKTTLLRMIARTTAPTEGRIEIRGRVGAMLGAEAAFSAALTGRENCFLTGAILGITRREVARQLDAIVDYADIGEFVDTPVRYYSSGMYLRLAIALTLQLKTEILVVDEALNACDDPFRQRAYESLRAAAMDGRSIIVVSHDLTAIRALCARSILLDSGQLVCDTTTPAAVALMRGGDAGSLVWKSQTEKGDCQLLVQEIRVVFEAGGQGNFNDTINVEIAFNARAMHVPQGALRFLVSIESEAGELLVDASHVVKDSSLVRTIRCRFGDLKLRPDWYCISVALFDSNEPTIDRGVRRAVHFQIVGAGVAEAESTGAIVRWQAAFSSSA